MWSLKPCKLLHSCLWTSGADWLTIDGSVAQEKYFEECRFALLSRYAATVTPVTYLVLMLDHILHIKIDILQLEGNTEIVFISIIKSHFFWLYGHQNMMNTNIIISAITCLMAQLPIMLLIASERTDTAAWGADNVACNCVSNKNGSRYGW